MDVSSGTDQAAWRSKFILYYETNAPDKTKFVTDAMMAKWVGKYDELYAQLEKKYGLLGFPLEASGSAPAVAAESSAGGPKKANGISAFRSFFEKSVSQEVAAVATTNSAAARPGPGSSNVIKEKEKNAFNGLETSTFTVCARIRPVLPSDQPADGDSFACIVPGIVGLATVNVVPTDAFSAAPPPPTVAFIKAGAAAPTDAEWMEQALILTPKVGITGKPKVEKSVQVFDHVFGPAVQDEEIFLKIGTSLTDKALSGQVGVVFAYGQTGSGKTHTMNGLLSRLTNELFKGTPASATSAAASGGPTVTVEFSYLEILGQHATDCLRAEDSTVFVPATSLSSIKLAAPAAASDGKGEGGATSDGSAATTSDYTPEGETEALGDYSVRIGEMLDGSIKTLNLSSRVCTDSAQLHSLVAIAQARRATQATQKNATSSRSHGVAILKVRTDHSTSTAAGGGGAGAGDGSDALRPAPGVLYIIDLAGSERLADSKNHSDERMEETKAINLSLMSLKECIRARTMAGAGDGRAEVHVPYRRSKLTLLMKDVFDISCSRLCSTVVLAHVSPLARDVQHSANTLGYAAPLRVATRKNPLKDGMHAYERDPNDPALWNASKCAEWIRSVAPAVDPNALISADAAGSACGVELCRTSEVDVFKRVLASGGAAADAQKIYSGLWTLICDAKVRRRRPNGTIITAEQEVAAREAEKVAREEKARLWKEREKHLKTEY